MTTIDHLLTFANETAALGVLTPLGFASNGKWDTGRVDPGVKLITQDAVWSTPVPDPNLNEVPVLLVPELTISGFHVTIALPETSDELEQIPPKALRVIENRGLATASSKFHEYAAFHANLPEGIATDMPAGQINRVGGVIENLIFKISPRFFGSDYPVLF